VKRCSLELSPRNFAANQRAKCNRFATNL
jgi:hypothetical protein